MMNIMHPVLRRLDLNLLLVLDAVYRHASVRRAAEELSMSTSALSHALSRLRESLNDPLFYREGHRMIPSVFATGLAPSVSQLLGQLNQALAPQPAFNPLTSQECFTMGITDYTAACVFPQLMASLQLQGPALSFDLRYLSSGLAVNELLAGEIDLALGFSVPHQPPHPELDEIDWMQDEYVVISHQQRCRLSFRDYLAARHLVVTPWNERQSVLDYQLQQMGHQRQIAIKTPSMLSGPWIVAETDLLMAIPRRAAERLQHSLPVTVWALPFDVEPFTVKILSHRRSGKKQATDWLKSLLCDIDKHSPVATQSGFIS